MDSHRRPGCFARMGGCLLVIVAAYVLHGFWKGHEARRAAGEVEEAEEAAAGKRADVERRIEDFAREKTPELQRALDELATRRASSAARLEELGTTLAGLGRDPERDEDWRRRRNGIADLDAGIADLIRRREEAFLLWEKFRLSEDPEERGRYEAALRAGKQAAETATQSLRELLASAR